MRIGYARVSSVDQSFARQEAALQEAGVERVFTEKVSGRDRSRPELESMLNFARPGDELVFASLDRMARSLRDTLNIIEEARAKGVAVTVIKEGLTFTGDADSPMDVLQLHMLSAFAEFERTLIRDRQREGIELAKARGTYAKPRQMTDAKVAEVSRLVGLGVPKAEVARRLGVSRSSVYRAISNQEEAQEA